MNEYIQPLPSVERFLERIGLKGYRPEVDLKSVDTLIEAFLTHIPYENLEVSLEHGTPSLTTEGLFDKLVVRKRGGYCYEMNGAMWLLLRDIGFQVYSVSAYILAGGQNPTEPTHRGNLVVLDGIKYYVDVGYGSRPIEAAIPVDGEREGYVFMYDERKNEYTLMRTEDGNAEKVLMFRDLPVSAEEFVPANEKAAASKTHPMAINMVCNIRTKEGGNYRLFNDRLKWKAGEERGEKTIGSEEELRDVIKEYFGIIIP